jgi:TATA-box binding protein (TBP) (component of TFIID and TFIIIB)
MKRTKETSRKGWNKMTGAQKLSICEDSIIETNFVSTLTFGSSIHTPRGTPANINIESIAKKTHAAVYHPSFDSVTLKLLSPPVTTTIYSTGVAVFMGADSDTKVIAAAHKIAYIITENQKEVIDPDSGRLTAVYIETVNIHNVVASVLAFPLDATILMRDWGHAIEQPEKFSGLTLTCAHLPITPPTNIVITIFPESGKMNITGARCKSEIPPVYRFVHEHILIPA